MEVRGAGKVAPAPGSVKSFLPSLPFVCGTRSFRGRKDAVDQAVRLGLLGAHEPVAVHVPLDGLDRLAGVLGVERVHLAAEVEDLPGLDLDVGGGALGAARGLVDHDPRVGQGAPLALGAGRQQERAHRGGHAHADGVHRRPQVLHGVVDGHAGRDHAARRVDVEVDVLVGVVGLEEEQLGDDDVRRRRR